MKLLAAGGIGLTKPKGLVGVMTVPASTYSHESLQIQVEVIFSNLARVASSKCAFSQFKALRIDFNV